MPLDPVRLRDWPIEDVEHAYGERDAIFYALALGLGADARDLRHVYEAQLEVLPTFVTTLADPGFWLRDARLALDWPRMLHGAQSITLHRPLAPCGCVRSRSRVVGIVDKGKEKGAIVTTRRELRDADTGTLVCTLDMTSLLRGDGGFGGEPLVPPESIDAPAIPARDPDALHEHRTLPQAALLFRLCGDMNPLHADPALAARAGYPAPILHGMATYGIACLGVLRALGLPGRRLRHFGARFTAPVYPGETLITRVWKDGAQALFTVHVVERGAIALTGSAAIAHAA